MPYVVCKECGEAHNPEHAEFVNIEEDPQGWDLLTFVYPVTKVETKAYVVG